MRKKLLRYTMISRIPGGEWLTGSTLTSYAKAHEYAINTSNDGLDCTMLVTRDGQFEYETRYYGLSDSQRVIKNLRKE